MRLFAILLILAPLLGGVAPARAQTFPQATGLADLSSLQQACRDSEGEGRPVLYAVSLPRFAFDTYDAAEGKLEVASRRNLRIFGGAAEIFTAELQPIAFSAGAERAAELRRVAAEGASLTLGFFLAFDRPSRRACLIRPAAGVTTVRVDLAFVELVSADGHVLARDDTDRMRAWADDEERDGIPGQGPRAALGDPSSSGASAIPDAWRRGVQRAGAGRLTRDLGRCHAAAVRRGGSPSADVILRLTLDGSSGRVQQAEVELSSLGDEEGTACVARVVQASLRLHADPSAHRVVMSLPVRLRAD